MRYPSDKQTADDQIASSALSVLQWNTTIPQDAVQVTVQKGLVTLNGQVSWQYQKNAAENAIRQLSGVTGVINDISLKATAIAPDVKRRI